jgi:hypothetical protein
MNSSTFTPEELRGFKLLRQLPTETLDLLAARLNKLDASYHTPQPPSGERPNIENPLVEISEEESSSFLYRLHFDSHPGYGRTVGHARTAIEKEPEHHRWHDLARQIDGVLREIPGLELGYASDGGPTGKFIAWAIKKITDETVEPGTVAKTLQPQRNRPGQT